MASASPSANRWLFGPAVDLLLGCGLAYLGLFALFVAAGDWWLGAAPGWLAPLCVLALSFPHYGATLLRVYEHRSDRRSYAVFTLWTTLALLALFAVGIYSVAVGSLLLTVYLTWSPWHYSGQNYGLAVMFLRRRGVALPEAAKRWLYASFVFSFGIALCAIHESSTWATSRSLPQAGPFLHFVPLGVPGAGWLVPALALFWAVTSLGVLGWIVRRGRDAALPVALLMLTQSLWFALPAAGLHWGLFRDVAPLAAGSVGAFLVWIAVGHAVQYLWVTAYFARATSDWRGLLPWFAKCLAAGALVFTVPGVLLAARPFGAPSYETGLVFLVASVVNIHHFALDGAIWKLRSGRIARILIASRVAEVEEEPERRWLRGGVWATASAAFIVAAAVFAHEQVLVPRALAAGDGQRAVALLERLTWAGRDSSSARHQAGMLLFEAGRPAQALAQLERSVALRPSAESWSATAVVRAALGDRKGSLAAQDHTLALRSDPALLEWAARLSDRLGERERAADLRGRASVADRLPASSRGRAALY